VGNCPLGYGPENDRTQFTATTRDVWTARQSPRHARLFCKYGDVPDRRSVAIPHLPVGGDLGSNFVAHLSQCCVHAERTPRSSGPRSCQRVGKLRGSGRTTGNGCPGKRPVSRSTSHASSSRDQCRSPPARPDNRLEYLFERDDGLASGFCGRPGHRQGAIRPQRDAHTPFGLVLTLHPRPAPDRRFAA